MPWTRPQQVSSSLQAMISAALIRWRSGLSASLCRTLKRANAKASRTLRHHRLGCTCNLSSAINHHVCILHPVVFSCLTCQTGSGRTPAQAARLCALKHRVRHICCWWRQRTTAGFHSHRASFRKTFAQISLSASHHSTYLRLAVGISRLLDSWCDIG